MGRTMMEEKKEEIRDVKPVWSPQTACKAYIDTLSHCSGPEESSSSLGVAELVSAMAAGWKARLIVETWAEGGSVMASIGLQVASEHIGGMHVCIVADERSRKEYMAAMAEAAAGLPPAEVMVGDVVACLAALSGVDFLLVDCRRGDFAVVLHAAELSRRGAVVVCKNAGGVATPGGFRWREAVEGGGRRVVERSTYLPVGKGLQIVHVAGGGRGEVKRRRRWTMYVDRKSGEVHVIRK